MVSIPERFFRVGDRVKFSPTFLNKYIRSTDHRTELSSWRGTIRNYDPCDHDDEIRYEVDWDVDSSVIIDLVLFDQESGMVEHLDLADCWHDAANIEAV